MMGVAGAGKLEARTQKFRGRRCSCVVVIGEGGCWAWPGPLLSLAKISAPKRPTQKCHQVADIFKKEKGIYIRSAVAMIVREGYQTRVGYITSGTFGCPQVTKGD